MQENVDHLINLVKNCDNRRAISFLDSFKGSYAVRVFNTARIQLKNKQPALLPMLFMLTNPDTKVSICSRWGH